MASRKRPVCARPTTPVIISRFHVNVLTWLRVQVLAHLDVLLPSLFDALSAPSDRVVAEALSVQAAIAADDPAQFRMLMTELLDRRAPGHPETLNETP